MAFRSADSPTAIPTSKRNPRIPVKRCMELKGLFLHVVFDVVDDGFSRRSREENLVDADCLKRGNILIGNDASGDDQNVIDTFFLQEFHNARKDDVMSARKDGKTDAIDIFLKSRIDDLLRSLAKA